MISSNSADNLNMLERVCVSTAGYNLAALSSKNHLFSGNRFLLSVRIRQILYPMIALSPVIPVKVFLRKTNSTMEGISERVTPARII